MKYWDSAGRLYRFVDVGAGVVPVGDLREKGGE